MWTNTNQKHQKITDVIWIPHAPRHKSPKQLLKGERGTYAYSGGGGLVLAHTTDLQWPVLCQLCPGLQPPAGWEIPRERMATVGLIPFHLWREQRELNILDVRRMSFITNNTSNVSNITKFKSKFYSKGPLTFWTWPIITLHFLIFLHSFYINHFLYRNASSNK